MVVSRGNACINNSSDVVKGRGPYEVVSPFGLC